MPSSARWASGLLVAWLGVSCSRAAPEAAAPVPEAPAPAPVASRAPADPPALRPVAESLRGMQRVDPVKLREFRARAATAATSIPEGRRPVFREIDPLGAGVDFVHAAPGPDNSLQPQAKGPGLLLLDANGDGLDDLAFTDYSASRLIGNGRPASTRLFLNQGGWRFRDATQEYGLGADVFGAGGAAADADGDGDTDLVIVGFEELHFYRNEGGRRFVEEPHALPEPRARWLSGASFLDYDRDGWLDLLVLGYTDWTVDRQRACLDAEEGPAAPMMPVDPICLPPSGLQLLRGGPTGYVDVTDQVGLDKPSRALGVSVLDLDDDLWPDLLIANDGSPLHLYRNGGDGRFVEVGVAAGVAYDPQGHVRAGMGVDASYLLGDERVCVALGFFRDEISPVYCQKREQGRTQALRFEDATARLGMGESSRYVVTFGLLFLDYDLDGGEDLFLANGGISRHEPTPWPEEPMLVFQNLGGQRLAEWIPDAGSSLARPVLARGMARADLDRDGDPDLVVAVNGGRPRLLRNDTPREGRHALTVRLEGTTHNRDGLGAHVHVRCGAREWRRYTSLATSFGSCSSPDVLLGLDRCAGAAEVRVRWLSGVIDVVQAAPDQVITVVEGQHPSR